MDKSESLDPSSSPTQNASDPADPQESQLHINLELPPGARLRVTLDARAPDGSLLEERSVVLENPSPVAVERAEEASAAVSTRQLRRLSWQGLKANLPLLLMGGALAVYLITRLVGLTHYPIYFFTDEAVKPSQPPI